MARLIDAESPQNRIYVSDLVIEQMKKIPAVDAVPVSELLALRDNLYETDRITMSGLYDLNMLISKYANEENEKWKRKLCCPSQWED
nr:MAG TPA: hypothetical protein [Caudoviricetes sp.]